MTKLVYGAALFLVLAVVMSGLIAPTCVAGSPNPCHDTEHPGQPPCDMKSCKRGNGNTCTHWCSKAKGCCFCDKSVCHTGTPDEDGEDQQ